MTHFVIATRKATKLRSPRTPSLRGAKRRSNPAFRSKLDWFAALAMTDVCARATAPQRSVPDGQITCPVPITKINAFVFDAKHFPNRAVSFHQGALAIVTDAGRDAMDADGTADERG